VRRISNLSAQVFFERTTSGFASQFRNISISGAPVPILLLNKAADTTSTFIFAVFTVSVRKSPVVAVNATNRASSVYNPLMLLNCKRWGGWIRTCADMTCGGPATSAIPQAFPGTYQLLLLVQGLRLFDEALWII
jgi:hypothetical protein